MPFPLCFFCMERESSGALQGGPGRIKWPEPMHPLTAVAICEECRKLSAKEKVAHIAEYVNCLREEANQQMAEIAAEARRRS
jgi:hypothetical protein